MQQSAILYRNGGSIKFRSMLLDKEVDVIVQKSLVFHNNLRNIDILDVDKDVVLATTANNNGKYQLYNTTIRTTGKIVFQAKYLEPICNESDKPVRIESGQTFEFLNDDMVIKPLGRSDRFIIAAPNENKFPFAKYQSNEEFTEEKNMDSAFSGIACERPGTTAAELKKKHAVTLADARRTRGQR